MMQAADSLEQVRHIVSDAVASTGSSLGKMLLSLAIGLAVGGFIAFYVGVARGRGMKGSIKEWVHDLATLNYRIVITIWLAVGFVSVVTIGMLLHAIWPRTVGELQEGVIDSVLIALSLWLGIDVGAMIGKRLSYKPEINSVQNTESRMATAEHRARGIPPAPLVDAKPVGVTQTGGVVVAEQPAAAEPMMAGEDGDLPRGRPK